MKLSYLQISGELIRNLQDSLSKKFDAKPKESVTQLVCKEHRNINKVLLEGVTVDNTISSLGALWDAMWKYYKIIAFLLVYSTGISAPLNSRIITSYLTHSS